MKSGDITVTDGRLLRVLKQATTTTSNRNSGNESSKQQDISITTGTLKKFYYDKQEAEVKTVKGTKKCYILKPFLGGADVYYSPFGVLKYDAQNKRTYFTVDSKVDCIILTIDDSNYILGYYRKNPDYVPHIVDGGVLRLESFGEAIQLGGNSGGIYFDSSKIIFKDWTNPEQRNKLHTSDLTEDNLNNKDYYTKEEVDHLLNKLKEELLKENIEGNE